MRHLLLSQNEWQSRTEFLKKTSWAVRATRCPPATFPLNTADWRPKSRARDPTGPPCSLLTAPQHPLALLYIARVAISSYPVGGIQSSAAASLQEIKRGRRGQVPTHFSINTRRICWGVAWMRAAAAICPLAGWGGGGGAPGWGRYATRLSTRLFPINRLPLIAALPAWCLAHTWIYSQGGTCVSSSQRSTFVCVCVCSTR